MTWGRQTPLMLGQVLDGRYQIQQVLGAGGFGQTYRAIDTRRPGQPLCVVKHLKPISHDPDALQTARRLFNSEAEILEKLGQHPQIPRLLAYFEQKGEFYLVQDYIDGHPLSAELSEGDRWTEHEVIVLLTDILPILDFVHARGAIHRDLKPDNLLRQRADNRLILIDFGAVKRLRTEPAENQTVVIGTPGYMASEQAQGQPCFGSDLYALGAIALQALTGVSPQKFEYNPHSGEIVWDRRLCSPELARILSRLVAYHFRDRYASARDASTALAALAQGASFVKQAPAAAQVPIAAQVAPPTSTASPFSRQTTYAVAGIRPATTPPSALTASQPSTILPRLARPLPLFLLFISTAIVAFSAVFAGVYAMRNRTPGVARSPESDPATPAEPEQPGWGSSWWDSINDSISDSIASVFGRDTGRCTVVAASGMNVRAEPNRNATRIGVVENGDALELSGEQENDWLEVTDPLRGWVYNDPQFITCTGLTPPDVTAAPAGETTETLETVEEPSPTRDPVSTAVRDRGQELLNDAQRRLENGDLQAALEVARSIPELSDTHSDAQQAIRTWQTEWERAQQAYNRAQQAIAAARWDDAIAEANTVVQNPYWRDRLQALAARARQRKAEQQAAPVPRPTVTSTPSRPQPREP
ncbi:MAG: protein kinase, partial [Spirulinaceae cyanobacterium SM2_1_0]|nr:protein kinase [Spirulinaceae cyanobacterium SM2_1_0]